MSDGRCAEMARYRRHFKWRQEELEICSFQASSLQKTVSPASETFRSIICHFRGGHEVLQRKKKHFGFLWEFYKHISEDIKSTMT